MIADMEVPAEYHLGEGSAASGWHSRVTGSYVLSVVSNPGSSGLQVQAVLCHQSVNGAEVFR